MGWHDVVSQETIKKILHFVPTGSRIIYVDYPVYYNIGDQLIMLGTEAFFRENQILPLARFSAHNFPWNLSFAKDIIIVCQGGGNFGDIWDFHQNFRNRLVEKFPYNQIVILPQSIYFENQNKARKVHNILEKHSKVYVFVRESDSESQLLKWLPGIPYQLCPDMSHMLWPSLYRRGGGQARESEIMFTQE